MPVVAAKPAQWLQAGRAAQSKQHGRPETSQGPEGGKVVQMKGPGGTDGQPRRVQASVTKTGRKGRRDK